jgi:cysteine-S-conjugate beta-lyase
MKYNFDEEVNRFNCNSLKWDVKKGELPMWVADTDFKTLPEVIDAINKKINIGALGYSIVPDRYFEAYSSFWKRRHNVELKKEWMVYSTGVVAAISSMVRKLTSVGENVLIQSPVYNIFYNSIYNNGRNILSSDLVYKDGKYSIDFKDLEDKMANPQTSLMILCNPHNPVGKIWTKDELDRIGRLAYKYNVLVISDEIHCENISPNKEYVPFISANNINKDISVTCLAMSKAFNLAGLQSACIVCTNSNLRHKVYRGINTDECGEPNIIAIEGNIAALENGDQYLKELNEYIYKNKKYFVDTVISSLDNVSVRLTDATYLLWVDVSKITKNSDALVDFIREKTGLIVSSGSEYGKNGDGFIRINLATTFKNVQDGTSRFIKSIKDFTKE